MNSSASPLSYRVIWTEHARRQVATLRDCAVAQGNLASRELAAHLRTISEALKWVPHDWGEPYLELKHLEVTLYAAFHKQLAVNYGVDDVHLIVYVRQLKKL